MSLDFKLLEVLETRRRADQQGAASPATGGGSGRPPEDPGLGERVTVLERTVGSIERTLSVMTEQMRHLATKDDVRAVQVELATLSGKLDADVATLSGKLGADIATLSGKLDAEVATINGKLDRKADATDLAELKGRVARIPTVPVLTSILVFVSLLFAAASWVLRHLPPSWANAVQ